MVQDICGIPRALFAQVADALVTNSGPGADHRLRLRRRVDPSPGRRPVHPHGGDTQTLLGNIGRPGGGILALRGHASIQGFTDIPTLFNILPGYIPMPHAHEHETRADFVSADAGKKGYWGHMDAYTVSLLKAWWGDTATAENDYCFDYLPRLTGDHGTYNTVMRQIDRPSRRAGGYFVVGENPAIRPAADPEDSPLLEYVAEYRRRAGIDTTA